MVADDASLPQIKAYLNRWLHWWIKTAGTWHYHELSNAYINLCWDPTAAKIAALAFQRDKVIELCTTSRTAAL